MEPLLDRPSRPVQIEPPLGRKRRAWIGGFFRLVNHHTVGDDRWISSGTIAQRLEKAFDRGDIDDRQLNLLAMAAG